jgi:glycyl-tRNA synthetase beta chain
LTTELVKEFTELQGIVGGLYARVQSLDDDLKPEVQSEIAKAIYDHYKPQSMEDDVPRTIEGAVLSIADKADTIAGMFALTIHRSKIRLRRRSGIGDRQRNVSAFRL